MPDLDWTQFNALPGAKWRNWELLCYGLIRRNYGAYGTLVAIRAQPVVEFHLTLAIDCPALGKAGEQWGWQCKFWDEEHPKLNTSRKGVINKAFRDQPSYLPDLDHWVIWTHHKLRKADWQWIQDKAPDDLEVTSWTDEDVSNLLVGDAEALRATYFGDHVLSPQKLSSAYTETKRTLRGLTPEIHVSVTAERALQAVRGRGRDWTQISESAESLSRDADRVEELVRDSAEDLEPGPILDEARAIAEIGRRIGTHLNEGLIYKAVQAARALPSSDRKARPGELELSEATALQMSLSNLRATAARASDEMQRCARLLSSPLLAVSGPVGAGKTELTALLGEPEADSPAGVIVAARSLRSGVDPDKLAAQGGLPAMSFDQLLEALDAAGARAGQRLPLVIDGLHESPDAPAWRDVLIRLRTRAERLSNVYVVVTVRPSYWDECIPEGVIQARLQGLGPSWRHACKRYFEHYKIKADLHTLPEERFSNPLFLRIFCEATNPNREDWVELGVVPSSLAGVLDTYLERALGRIRDRLRIDPDALRVRIRTLARYYWDHDAYALYIEKAKELLGDSDLALDDSLAYALEDEGVLDRDLTPDGRQAMSPAFDALGGFLIADALLPSGQARDAALAATSGRLTDAAAHPLAEDIRQALGHLFITRAHCALHQEAADPALRRSATLDLLTADSTALTAGDIEALTRLVVGGERLEEKWLVVMRNRALPEHPFNANWLHRTLGAMSVARRDLDWTEAVRFASEELLFEVESLTTRWRTAVDRNDELNLRWLAWLLTSTDRQLRDRATEAIYWFGRQNPSELHALTLETLDSSDPYVPERLLAACYGVAMANQIPTPDWLTAMPAFLDGLNCRLFGPNESPYSAHYLSREYIIGIWNLVARFQPQLVLARKTPTHSDIPTASGDAAAIQTGDERYEEASLTLRTDFHNYTLGRLYEGRGNYDFNHPGHHQGVAEVLGRVWDLGWRKAEFAQIDRSITEFSGYQRDLDPARVDRYGKKYGWIGFYELAGRRAHLRQIANERLSDVDIDPSFPLGTPTLSLSMRSWIRTRHASDESWTKNGKLDIPESYLVAPALDALDGPWICLDGFLTEESDTSSRRPFCFIWAAFVKAGSWSNIAATLGTRSVGRHTMPEPSGDYYTFAGEIPWAPAFAESLRLDGLPDATTLQLATAEGAAELTGAAHEYSWESYHSVTNTESGAAVPSKAISTALQLRGLPQTFDLASDGGTIASRSLRAPSGFGGRMLYLRADELQTYLTQTDTEMGWLIWGEREMRFDPNGQIPTWYSRLVSARKNEHRRIVSLNELLGF